MRCDANALHEMTALLRWHDGRAAVRAARSAMPKFTVLHTDGCARRGALLAPSGKELQTPALLVSTTHGHAVHNENSAIARLRNPGGGCLGVAVSGIEMCVHAVAVRSFAVHRCGKSHAGGLATHPPQLQAPAALCRHGALTMQIVREDPSQRDRRRRRRRRPFQSTRRHGVCYCEVCFKRGCEAPARLVQACAFACVTALAWAAQLGTRA